MSELVKFKDPGELAHRLVDELLEDFKRPAWRAGCAAAMLTTIVIARSGVRGGLAVFVALSVGAAVEQLYTMAENIHDAALMKLDPPQLMFHGMGCPGHTTGMPAECCMAESDATGKV